VKLMSASVPRGVIAVVRTDSPEHALTIGRGLSRTRVAAIEVTMTVPDAVDVIGRLASEGVQRVGAGTVRTADQVKACAAAGAAFVVSPHTDPAVVRAAVDLGLAVVPGTLTPSEVVAALAMGATGAKIFPVGAVGGIAYVRALLEPLPDLPLVVSGGIEPVDVPGYREAGAVGVCLGRTLWRLQDVAAGDVEAVCAYASSVLDVADPLT
jgi:2-dehydro-3-deoxyphosphogluconate aldolase / (4S)-4-hydroxy-2-oxoglutarate aldolase